MTNMKTITIKGKEYVPVVERVKEFHRLYCGNILTEVVDCSPSRVSIKAIVTITGHRLSDHTVRPMFQNATYTGHSQAEWGKGMMGGVALEVAETSAVGRALGFANIGLLDGIASADEIRKVSKKVNTDKPPFGEGSVEEENEDFNI